MTAVGLYCALAITIEKYGNPVGAICNPGKQHGNGLPTSPTETADELYLEYPKNELGSLM